MRPADSGKPPTARRACSKNRPMTCRVFGPPVRMGGGDELGHCELCFEGASEAEVAACEMPLAYDLESELLAEIPSKDETVVAFALLG